MPLTQVALSAAITNSVPLAADANQQRHYLYIRNYATSTHTVWVAFNRVATAGTAGELEILPGFDFVFGGNYPEGALPTQAGSSNTFYSANTPQGSVNVITSAGTATGCVLSISYPQA